MQLKFKKEDGKYISRFIIENGNHCTATISGEFGYTRVIRVTTVTPTGHESETVSYSKNVTTSKQLINNAFLPILKTQL